MKILVVDTATPTGVLGVYEDPRILGELQFSAGKNKGELLAVKLSQLLHELGLSARDIDAYAVGLGPGSFTGLRAGLALVKGFALAHPRPVVGVSTLQALAMNAESPGLVLPLIDARKGEVFTALFEVKDQGVPERQSPDLALSPPELSRFGSGPLLVLGTGLERFEKEIKEALPQADFAGRDSWTPRVENLGKLALARLGKGEEDPVETLAPAYVRFSDQELRLGPRR